MASMRTRAADAPGAFPVVPTRARHTVVGFLLGLIAIAYLDRVCIATAAPAMRAELGLTDAHLGSVVSGFTFGYAVFGVPGGSSRTLARIASDR